MRVCPKCLSVYGSTAEHCALDGERILKTDEGFLVGQRIGPFEVQECLGLGTFGAVFRALDERRHPVALKCLLGDMAGNNEVAARFERETLILQELRHPNIVGFRSAGTSPGGVPYIATELLVGRTVREELRVTGPISLERAAQIGEQIASGLSIAHHRGVVHRDLKPGNVMLVPKGALEEVKIFDFGVAAPADRSHKDDNLTKQGFVLGTPKYMAPEQLYDPAIGPTGDVYALGVLLYEVITGTTPFELHVFEELVEKKMSYDPEPPPGSGTLGNLAAQCMNRTVEKRPQNGAELVARFRRLGTIPPPAMRRLETL